MAASRADLFAFLDRLGIATETHAHAPVFTVAQSHALGALLPGGHTKNLFLTDRRGSLFLVVALHETAVDLKRLHVRLGCGRLSFGRPELLRAVLGVEPGSVTPFAVLNDSAGRVVVVVDEALMAHDPICCHPLRNDATTAIARADLLRFLAVAGHPPRIVHLAAAAPAA